MRPFKPDKIMGTTDSVPNFSDVMDGWEIEGIWKEYNYGKIADPVKGDVGEIEPVMMMIS